MIIIINYTASFIIIFLNQFERIGLIRLGN